MSPQLKLLEKPYLPLAVTLLLVACLVNAVKPLDRAFFDACTRASVNPAAVPANGVLVLVDETSLAAVGKQYSVRWPWPRSLFAGMIASLHHAGAAKIVMDFEFLEPSAPEQDDVLAAYAAACPEVVLGRTHDKIPAFWNADFQRQYPSFAVTNRLGLVDFLPADDGVYRSYSTGDSLAAKAMTHPPQHDRLLLRWYGSVGTTNPACRIATNQALSAARFVILGEQLQEQLRAKGVDDTNPGNIVAALDALPPLADAVANSIKDKIVFVGANAAATTDLKPTPLGRIEPGLKTGILEPGVLVHFTAWANAERGDDIRPTTRWASVSVGLLLALCLVLVGWRRNTHAAWMALVGAMMILVVLAGSALAFRMNYFFAPTLPAAAVFVALLVGTTHNFWRERKQKREIEAVFGSYVAKAVVEKLIKDPASIRLGGERKELTVFFSDLAGFTDLSERLPPEELVQVVNRYLAAVTDFILDNHGYVDKYIGDAVMGVFGSPEPLPNHAVAACHAALATRDWMEKAFADSPVKLRARIGLNTGPMVVGNVGSERKKNYTVLGDAVNLASRLEAANKEVGTLILVGEDTERLVRGQFLMRPIARLRVKGKQQPNQTFELVSEPGAAAPGVKEFVTIYTAAYDAFMKRDFAAAHGQFQRVLALRPDDRMTQLYLDKAAKFEYEKSTQLTPDWDVVELKTK